jgi:hypothetical protein
MVKVYLVHVYKIMKRLDVVKHTMKINCESFQSQVKFKQ